MLDDFLLIRPTDFFWPFSLPSTLRITRFYSLFEYYININESLAKVCIHEFTCQRGEGRLGCSWSVTKRAIKQKAEPQNIFSQNFVVSRALETSIYIFHSSNSRWLPLMWLIWKQNARYKTAIPFPTLLSFFTPTRSVCTDGLSGVHRRHSQIFSYPSVPNFL